MASITLFISWVSINKNLAIADKQYLLLCGLNSSVTRRLARKCSCFSCWLACNNCVASGMVAVCSFSTLHYNQVVWLMCCTMGPDEPFFLFETVFWLCLKKLINWAGNIIVCTIYLANFHTLQSAGSLFFLRYCTYDVIYAYSYALLFNWILISMKTTRATCFDTLGMLMWNLCLSLSV